MSKCIKCNIEILDPGEKCPLCNAVLEQSGEKRTAMYPNARKSVRRFRLLENVVLFASIVVMVGVILANYLWEPFVSWTIVIGLLLLYANVTLRLAILGQSGYMVKTLLMVFLGLVILLEIDALTGQNGWAVNYVLPAGMMLLDLALLILIIVNRYNWQSYLILEILQLLWSVLLLVLILLDVITHPVVTVIAIAFSVLLFLGTLILGDRPAREELKRRFHL
jgi:hypothetical protein